MHYLRDHGTGATDQREKAKKGQRRNEAGGFVWKSEDWQRLRRFLILGSEGGSYYVGEQKLTKQNVTCLRRCIADDGALTVAEILAVSKAGRAPSNDPALFALANVISLGDNKAKRAAAEALPAVARIGSDLFKFASYAETMRGWGRTMRWAVGNWYEKHPDQLAFQVVKYRSRAAGMPETDPWSHRDLLRLAHPYPGGNAEQAAIFDWTCHPSHEGMPSHVLISAYEAAQHPSCTPTQAAALILSHRLPREALQTEHLNDPVVWRALLDSGMPLGAMIRNLPTMTRHGVLQGQQLLAVTSALTNPELLQRARIHPLGLLIALYTYAQGRGRSRERQWVPLHQITDALDEAFYLSFGTLEGSGKRTLVAIDISGSMSQGSVAGSGLSPRLAAAALAMCFLHSESQVELVGIDGNIHALSISKRQRLDDVMRSIPVGGRTNLALPFVHARRDAQGPEVFVTITDNETWAGGIHPFEALADYRRRSGIPARSVALAMVANKWSLHDPDDALALDCVGFDAATPNIIADFTQERF